MSRSPAPSPLRTSEPSHLQYLDGLRGIAILMVVMVHCVAFLNGSTAANGISLHSVLPHWLLDPFFAAGSRGVPLFFFLSAFTLYRSFSLRREGKLATVGFYIRRFFRIQPLYIVCVLAIGALTSRTTSDIFYALTFLFGFFPNENVVPGAWSLFVEETFYLAFPLLWKAIGIRLDRAVLFACCFYCIEIIWRHFGIHHHINPTWVFFFPLSHYCCFFGGIALFLLTERLKPGTIPALTSRWAANLATLVAVICICDDNAKTAWMGLLFVFFQAYYWPSSWIGRLTRTRHLGLFGKHCYFIYLTHFILISQTLKLVVPLVPWIRYLRLELVVLLTVALYASVLLGAALLSWRFFEFPFIQLGKRLVHRLTRPKTNEGTVMAVQGQPLNP